jgi:hypothetical protein
MGGAMRDFSRRDFLRETTVTLAVAALAAHVTPAQAAAAEAPVDQGFIDVAARSWSSAAGRFPGGSRLWAFPSMSLTHR